MFPAFLCAPQFLSVDRWFELAELLLEADDLRKG